MEIKEVKVQKCTVCLNNSSSEQFVKGMCGHEFHYSCFEKWIKNKYQLMSSISDGVSITMFSPDDIKCLTCNQDWKFEEKCAICRDIILAPMATGACGHKFHLPCIQKWTKVREVCPLDNRKWKFGKSVHTMKHSLKELCCRKIASDVNLVMECFQDHHLIDESTWALINKNVKSWNIKTPGWMNRDMRQIMAKMFHGYYPQIDPKKNLFATDKN